MFVSGKKLLISNFPLVISPSFGNVTPNYNIALVGNSDSLYELSPVVSTVTAYIISYKASQY
jgi:hypothetical protein